MPKYFKTKAKMLHAEATATFMLIELACAMNVTHGMLPDRFSRKGKLKANLVTIYMKAENRMYRRSILAFGK